ncbi:MAG: site-specific DNA-methyltransferase [Clostridiales bacterium]|nr:site-specific DNA-methyltransferase [Clostridiales bacterium]
MGEKARAGRNKTIYLTEEEEKRYLASCLTGAELAGMLAGSCEAAPAVVEARAAEVNPAHVATSAQAQAAEAAQAAADDAPVEASAAFAAASASSAPAPSLAASAPHPFANRIVLGDNMAVLDMLPHRFADLLIADPPYNLDKTYGAGKFRKMEGADYEAYTRRWIEKVRHTLKDTASIYICCDWRSSLIIGSLLSDYFLVRNRITWQREKGRGAVANWKNSMEDVWFATCSKEYTFDVDAVKQRRLVRAPYREGGKPKGWQDTEQGRFRDTYPSNFWDDISIPYWSMPENTGHPAQKPEKLFAKLILASTEENGFVLDPFAGTGASAVAAKKLNRRYLGIEIDPGYCALAARRLEMADADRTIQGYADGVFWERNTSQGQQKSRRAQASRGAPGDLFV